MKKIPKWAWVGGGIAVILMIVILYEHRNQEEASDPCNPADPNYDPEKCPSPEQSYPAKQIAMPSGAAGGMNYYLPLGYGTGTTTAKGAEDAVPTEPTETLSEPNPPAEPVQSFPSSPSGAPGTPVPGSSPSEGLYNAVPAPSGGVVVGTPIPAPSGPSIAPAVPAPSGWCGHPNAVGVGQPCSYKNTHNPPAGWHWFCCNGMLGRAPN